jgi:parallel beta-helix repeat protein
MKLLRFAPIGAIALGTVLSATAPSAMAQMPFPATANTPGLSADLSLSPPYTCVNNYYINSAAPNASDFNPGTLAQPWKTIYAAQGAVDNSATFGFHRSQAGDCYNVMPGTYTLDWTIPLSLGGNSNSATGYVVYRSTVPQGAHIVPSAKFNASGDIFQLQAGYFIIDGFDIDGNNAFTNGDGIDGCAAGGQQTFWIAHHFVAINNLIHNLGGAGLSSCNADFVIWRNNVVYNNASTSPYQKSGININGAQGLAAGSYTPTAWDTAMSFGIQILYNISHDNLEGPVINWAHTDGNGIIIDTSYNCSSGPNACAGQTPYPGQMLILGNLSYNNGGSGIQVFESENVTIANNTCYNNHTDAANPGTARGELMNAGSANINFVNNVAIAVPGTGILANNRPAVSFPISGGYADSGTWTRNITFGASNVSDATSRVSTSTNLVNVNPKLISPATGNFGPLPGSPTVRTGMPESYLPSRTPDIGAY